MLTREPLQPYLDQGLLSEQAHPDNSDVRIYNYTAQCTATGVELIDRLKQKQRGREAGTVSRTGPITVTPWLHHLPTDRVSSPTSVAAPHFAPTTTAGPSMSPRLCGRPRG
jgi:hypothetical protein